MNPTPPEANSEYSRAPGLLRGVSGGPPELSSGQFAAPGTRLGAGSEPPRARAPSPSPTSRALTLTPAVLGATWLLAAEFKPLFHVRVLAKSAQLQTVLAGVHHGYALIPIAALSILLALTAVRYGSRPALGAIGAFGLIALLVALVGDLPAARASGLVGSGATHYLQAGSSPAIGLYLETLGAVLLLGASGLGLLLLRAGARAPSTSEGA